MNVIQDEIMQRETTMNGKKCSIGCGIKMKLSDQKGWCGFVRKGEESKCPCVECLVKPMCRVECIERYRKYVKYVYDSLDVISYPDEHEEFKRSRIS